MPVRTNDCRCNDYSQLTANTGIASLTTADSGLDGSTAVTVLTAGSNGTILKSVIIKSTEPTISGMIRLFIQNGSKTVLFREIPVPVAPVFYPYPTNPISVSKLLIEPMFVAYLICDIVLEDGDVLCATTQNDGAFNEIAEGLDIAYPATKACCDNINELPNTGIGVITTANKNLDGTGAVAIFTADATFNGSVIKSISIDALQSTSEGMVRLFISPDSGTTYYLFNEIYIPQSTQASNIPSFKVNIPMNYNLMAGYMIGATTAISEKFGISIQAVKWTYPA